jgi:transposase
VKREEITKILDSLKPAIESITDGNVQAIINALIAIINEQQIIIDTQQNALEAQKKEIEELKEKLNTNSKNSSKSPSSERFKKKKTKKKNRSKRKQGGQPGHKGVFRELLPADEVDHIEIVNPSKRCECGSRIRPTTKFRRHQVHELPKVKAIVTEYQLYLGICFGCGKTHQAELPIGVPTGMLGHYAMGKIGTLTGDYRMSKRQVTFLLQDFYDLHISVGTVSNAEKIVSAALEKPVEEAKNYVPKQTRVNGDETSHAEKGNKMWTWVFIASLVAVFIIRPSRSAQVAKDFLGAKFKGILSTDRWSAYAWLAVIFRQLCWAHLKRDFQKISERSGKSARIGDELLACTKKMFRYWHKVKDGTLSRKRFKKLMDPIRKRVEALLEEGKQCGHKKTAGTCKNLLKLKEALWTFLDKKGLEPTNNLAEQILRRIVIWRKTSFGTQSPAGTLYLERIMTVVATCKMQKRNVLDFVTDAVRAHLNGTTAPSLLQVSECKHGNLKVAND